MRQSPPQPDATPFLVFLDRDGVFNVNPRLAVARRNGFRFLPGALAAFARLNRPDIVTCLCTNQPLLGTLTLGLRVRAVHDELRRRIAAAGGRLDRIEASYSPPLPFAVGAVLPRRLRHGLRRRKPGPGLLEDGARALGIPLPTDRAVMVGDKPRDAGAAAAAGVRCILLATTHTEAQLRNALARRGIPVAAIVPGLPEAVDLILSWAS